MFPPSLFRPASLRSTRANIAWTLLQSTLVWTLALIVAPAILLKLEAALGIDRVALLHHPAPAIVLFILFSMMNLLTGIALASNGKGTPLPVACPRELVIIGPYRYVRNPMAIAGVGQGIAVALWCGSLLVFLYALTGALVWHFIVRPSEERDLLHRFGPAYESYKAAVPLWTPRRALQRDPT